MVELEQREERSTDRERNGVGPRPVGGSVRVDASENGVEGNFFLSTFELLTFANIFRTREYF